MHKKSMFAAVSCAAILSASQLNAAASALRRVACSVAPAITAAVRGGVVRGSVVPVVRTVPFHCGTMQASDFKSLTQGDAVRKPEVTSVPLHEAAKNGDIKLLEELILEGLPVNERDPITGSTLMHLAIERRNVVVVAVLRHCRVDLSIKDANGLTPYSYAQAEHKRILNSDAYQNKAEDLVKLRLILQEFESAPW